MPDTDVPSSAAQSTRSDQDRDRDRRRRPASAGVGIAVRAVALAALLLSATVLAVPALVSAGDQNAVIRPSPATVEVEPGETVTIEIELQSDGGHNGVGVRTVDLVAQYHPDYLAVADLERGPWLEQGNETAVRAERTLAHDDGTAILEQRRDPPAGGATGNAMLATMTVEVAADAPPATTAINFSETSVEPVRGWPLKLVQRPVTVEIAGGGEEVPAADFDHPDPDSDALESAPADELGDGDERSEGASDADSAADSEPENGSADGNGDGNAGAGGTGDAIPGFTAALAGLAVGAALVGTLLGGRTGGSRPASASRDGSETRG